MSELDPAGVYEARYGGLDPAEVYEEVATARYGGPLFFLSFLPSKWERNWRRTAFNQPDFGEGDE